ncbi:MAG: Na(+)-translocating NADH-quinone reductase subunit A [Bacteroidota bacterium]
MKIVISRSALLLFFVLFANILTAQSAGGEGMSYFIYILLAVAVLIFLGLIIQVSDNLIAIEAKQSGVATENNSFGIAPKMSDIIPQKVPGYVTDAPIYNLKKGYDILLEGGIEDASIHEAEASTFAIQPPNFLGVSPIPKMELEVGGEVKAGDVLFFDKKKPEIKYVAPVSGELIAINRAEKRSIAEVVILADKEMKYKELDPVGLESSTREALVNFLMESGAWPLIRQRPFNVIAEPEATPRDIFITTFDTAPLAPNLEVVVQGKEEAFQKGLDVLGKLTSGSVHLGLDGRTDDAPAAVFSQASGVHKKYFNGKHPAGNVGVQIHNVDQILAGDIVWTLGVQDVVTLGALFTEQRFNAERVVAVTGAELKTPKYVKTFIGAKVGDLVKDNIEGEKVRIISGDVLSGKAVSEEQFLHFYDDQITVIEEGDYYEAFGWLLPIKPRPSVSRTFPNFLFPDLTFKADSNTHGEKRAFVVTGQYEQVMPMDIYLQHLMKSIIVNDFERMEGLGIYELVAEDVALAEFVCTSKQPLQSILADGIQVMREQG